MAKEAVKDRGIPIRVGCAAFGISEACYRYSPRLSSENKEIADHLLRLTHNQRNWGFGLCFLYLRNVRVTCGTTNGCIGSIASSS